MKAKLLKFGLPAMVVLAGAYYYASKTGMFLDRDALIAKASVLAEQGELEAAEETVQPLLKLWDVPDELWLFVGNINRIEGDFNSALDYLSQVSKESPKIYAEALLFRAEANMRLGHLSPARDLFAESLADNDRQPNVRRRLVFVLNLAGLIRESLPEMMDLVNSGHADPELLLLLCDMTTPRRNDELIATGLPAFPEDPLLHLAHAMILESNQDDRAALEEYEIVMDFDPKLAIAWTKGFATTIRLKDRQRVKDRMDSIPEQVESIPGYWVIKGDVCRTNNKLEAAAHCYTQAALIAPDHIEAHFQLGQVLRELGRLEEAASIVEWANDLSHLAALSRSINKNALDVSGTRNLAKQLLKLNRIDEAWNWAALWLQIDPDSEAASKMYASLDRQRSRSGDFMFPPGPASQVNLTELPDLPWKELNILPDSSEAVIPNSDRVAINFEDVSEVSSFDFQYQNGTDSATEGRRIFEYTGGGVGVLDYDLDGWPDLYMTQGGKEGPTVPSTDSDQLIRNIDGQKYLPVTGNAGIRELSFSQGVSVGDINNDGFPDVYIANFGRNRLWQNNGDGTFADITDEAGLDGDSWTTSCAIADLNGDGSPELFDVNYLTGENLLTQVCYSNGVPRVCTPVVFAPAQDHLWENEGDGRFLNATESSGLVKAQGNGLGVLVADFDRDSRLDLFTANDAVANHYWVNSSDGSLKLEESALLSGAAVNSSGRAEACMGIAAGDTDGDGLLDLFVTNFFEESNTLYRQRQPHLFVDETREMSLQEPGYRLLGFGTQFLDADLDGWQDSIVLNGDIDDFSFMGREERMQPLFLRNQQGQSFTELEEGLAGPFFSQKMLGRSVARLDWNRDGKPDFVASILDAPSQLVENKSAIDHHWLAVKLIGIVSSRDAIGTQVTVETGGLTQSQQLTAGDGYQCSNEKIVLFGLSEFSNIDSLTVTWPSGVRQQFDKVSVDRLITIREGDDRLH